MIKPTATTESPKHQLQIDFERMAKRSFELCVAELLNVDFYNSVLRKIDAGKSIADELPVTANLSPEVVRETVQRLKLASEIAANEAWELPSSLKGSFLTTVRSELPDEELIPQYDVEYRVETDVGPVKVLVNSWRRRVSVEVKGSELALDAAYGQMVFAGVIGHQQEWDANI